MSTATDERIFTPDALLEMPDGDRFELVRGRLVERNMGFQSSRIGGTILWHMRSHAEQNRLGWVLNSEAGYCCFPDDPDMVRKPDASFISAARLPLEEEPTGWCRIAPDLAVEVVSPNDLMTDVMVKVREYLAAGVRLVWVVVSASQTVHVFHEDGRGEILNSDDELDGGDVLPGFRVPVAELFRPPAGAAHETRS